jgi:hypothetical protein
VKERDQTIKEIDEEANNLEEERDELLEEKKALTERNNGIHDQNDEQQGKIATLEQLVQDMDQSTDLKVDKLVAEKLQLQTQHHDEVSTFQQKIEESTASHKLEIESLQAEKLTLQSVLKQQEEGEIQFRKAAEEKIRRAQTEAKRAAEDSRSFGTKFTQPIMRENNKAEAPLQSIKQRKPSFHVHDVPFPNPKMFNGKNC